MKLKLLKALWFVVRNAPAIVEVVKKARERHSKDHTEPVA